MATKKKKKNSNEELISESLQLRAISLVVIFFIIVAAFKLGIVGRFIDFVVSYFFGSLSIVIYVLGLIFLVYYMIKLQSPPLKGYEMIGIGMIILALLMIFSVPGDHSVTGFSVIKAFFQTDSLNGGGMIGSLLYALFSALFDYIGSIIAFVLMMIAGLGLMLVRTYLNHKKDLDDMKENSSKQMHQYISNKKEEREARKLIVHEDTIEPEEDIKAEIIEVRQPSITEAVEEPVIEDEEAVVDTSEYVLPPESLLKNPEARKSNEEAKAYALECSRKLSSVLKEFGVNATIRDIFIGPSVTKYELTLETGTRVNKISQLQDDIKLALATRDIRIEAPIPGKSAVGIEVPNLASSTVTFKEVYKDIPAKYSDDKLLVPLGKDVTGNSIFARLDEMPHLLIAGATGSGKSVCVNTIICSILMRTKPDEVKLLLIDPKKVELTHYDGVAHLLRPVVTDPKKASIALRTVVEEMERRYDLFAQANTRNIRCYNQWVMEENEKNPELKKAKLPYIVVILDEVADLMMVASKDVEDCIMRISQMARAAGIHMIIATQRPSTDVITGVIKANIPSRIAFAVSSSVDSRTILDMSGAEKLLGKGDMLYYPMGASSPLRLQGAYVSDEEVNAIVDFIKNQKEAKYEEKYLNLEVANNSSFYDDEEDEEYERAREFVIQAQKASASLLQRQFRIGYNKAARLIDQLEANGVIGPQIGSKPREVYIKSYSEEDI